MEKLILIEGGRRREFPLRAPAMTIGRGSGNDIVVADSRASRRHCRIARIGEAWYLEDLDSSNGTFRNGLRVTGPVRLAPGDRIRVGDTTLHAGEVCAAKDAAVEAPAPAEGEPAQDAAPAVEAAPAKGEVPEEEEEEEEDLSLDLEDLPARAAEAGPGAPPQAVAVFLESRAGTLEGKRIPIAAFPFTIGRTARNDLRIPEPRTSGEHARIVREGERISIEDRGSTNGTWLNGERIQRADLRPGDEIAIGRERFLYHGPGSPRPRAVIADVRPVDGGFIGEDAFARARVRAREAPETPGAVAFGAAAAGVVVAAAVLVLGFDVLQRFLNPPPVDPNAPENAIRDNYSFEDDPHGAPPSGWTVSGPEGVSVRVDRKGPAAAPGRAALRIEAPRTPEPVWVSQRIPRGSEPACLVRASIRSHGVLAACLAVTWLRPVRRAPPPTGGPDSAGDLRASFRALRTDFAEIPRDPVEAWEGFEDAQAVIAVPRGAEYARVSCLVFGPGGASFDRVEFLPAEGEGPADIHLDGGSPLVLDLAPDGAFRLGPEGARALEGVRLLLDPAGDPELHGQRLGRTAEPFGGTEDGGARGRRWILDRARGAWVDVEEKISVSPGEIEVAWRLRDGGGGLPEAAALAFRWGGRSDREPVTSYGQGGVARFRLAEIDGKTLREFSLGRGAEQVSFAFGVPVAFRAVEREGLPAIYVASAPVDALPRTGDARAFSVVWTRFSPREDRKVREIFQRAEDLAGVGEAGAAIRILQEIPARFPLRRADVERARKRIAELEAAGEALLEEIRQAARDFQRYGSPLIQESIRRRAEEAARRFAGHALAERIRELAASIRVEQTLAGRAGPDPRELLAAGERCFRQGRLGLAELYLERLVRDFPDAPAVEKARELRIRIDGRLRGLEERAFEDARVR